MAGSVSPPFRSWFMTRSGGEQWAATWPLTRIRIVMDFSEIREFHLIDTDTLYDLYPRSDPISFVCRLGTCQVFGFRLAGCGLVSIELLTWPANCFMFGIVRVTQLWPATLIDQMRRIWTGLGLQTTFIFHLERWCCLLVLPVAAAIKCAICVWRSILFTAGLWWVSSVMAIGRLLNIAAAGSPGRAELFLERERDSGTEGERLGPSPKKKLHCKTCYRCCCCCCFCWRGQLTNGNQLSRCLLTLLPELCNLPLPVVCCCRCCCLFLHRSIETCCTSSAGN